MKLARLVWKLLRYRVAVMLLLFMLLAAALHGALTLHPWPLVIAGLALACSYVSATSTNDLADEKIDAINHPDSPGRPLVTGAARTTEMWQIFGLASVVAILLCAVISWRAAAIMTASILLNVLYSLPPARLSYRTFLAPLVLGLAYVGVPYLLALAAIGARFNGSDVLWLVALYLMFVGRIILKDFRDRTGDAEYHKPTFLLRFGKPATCAISAIGLTLGGLLLVWQVRSLPWLAITVMAYLGAMLLMLWRLRFATVGREEQISIGVGAKMGNGLLLTLLCGFALRGAAVTAQLAVTLLVAALFFGNYVTFLRHPHRAVLGYKG